MSWCSRLLIPCAVGVVLVVSIWGGSLAHHRGLVTYDSDYYLRQAAFFVEGRGLHSLGELEPEPFTTWPLGYPLAIAGAAKLTGLSVFWAAKVVDTAAALICIVLLLYALPRTGGMASVAWLSGGIITTFSATYAEGIFILAMLVATLALARLLDRESASAAVILATAVAAAFCIRYVGLVLLVPVLAGCLWAAAKGRPRAVRLLVGSLVGAAVPIGAYLWLNYVISGALLPGAARRRESLLVFIYESAKALVAEVNFVFVYVPHPRHPILLAAFAAVIVLTVAVSLQMTVRGRGAGRGLGRLDSGERVTIVVLALTGVFFWASMVLLKSSRDFNVLGARLLAPGTVLVTAAALSGLAARGFREHRGVKAATVLIVLASVAYTSVYRPLAQYRAQPILFPERLQNIHAHYTDVPAGTVVLYGPRHLPFLRPDLRVIMARRITSPDRFRRYVDQAHKAGIPVYVADEDRPPTVVVQ